MRYFFTNDDAYYLTAARFGAFGVDIFFGLSGVLITGLLLKQWGETGAISLKAFYTRRAFRILPNPLGIQRAGLREFALPQRCRALDQQGLKPRGIAHASPLSRQLECRFPGARRTRS